eukprot:TRINITY_DN10592_c0_g2_i2.p1 TRINITY_DN10592_c0_g2~~TRINITY_DN10592_c0_g2_i2.p1  ORF type:complete len:571 (-),score=123.89 TRINITY_DN10592_c0_g2_i2:87-1799(-)
MEAKSFPPSTLTPNLQAAQHHDTGPTGWNAQMTALLQSEPLAGSEIQDVLADLGMTHRSTIVHLRESDLLSRGVTVGHARYLMAELFTRVDEPAATVSATSMPTRPPAEFTAVVPACDIIVGPGEWMSLSLDLVGYIATWDQSFSIAELVRQQFDSPWTDLSDRYEHGSTADAILARAMITAMRAPAASVNMRDLVEADLRMLHGMKALQTLSRQILLADDDLDTARKELVRHPQPCRGDEFLAADLQKLERALKDCQAKNLTIDEQDQRVGIRILVEGMASCDDIMKDLDRKHDNKPPVRELLHHLKSRAQHLSARNQTKLERKEPKWETKKAKKNKKNKKNKGKVKSTAALVAAAAEEGVAAAFRAEAAEQCCLGWLYHGKCMYEGRKPSCPNAHPPAKRNTVEAPGCRDFASGNCSRGQCVFKHAQSVAQPAPAPSSSLSRKDAKAKKISSAIERAALAAIEGMIHPRMMQRLRGLMGLPLQNSDLAHRLAKTASSPAAEVGDQPTPLGASGAAAAAAAAAAAPMPSVAAADASEPDGPVADTGATLKVLGRRHRSQARRSRKLFNT